MKRRTRVAMQLASLCFVWPRTDSRPIMLTFTCDGLPGRDNAENKPGHSYRRPGQRRVMSGARTGVRQHQRTAEFFPGNL